jgi:hypothetical protein
VCQRFLLAHSVPAAWGEPARPGFPPGETGKGEFKLPCCRRHFALAWHRWQARPSWSVRSLFSHVFLQIPITNHMSITSIRFPEVLLAPPTACRASIRTLNGPRRGPVQVGVRSKAQVRHHGDGPGLLGAAIYSAISERISRSNAVTRTRRWMSWLTKLLDVCWPSRHQLMLAMLPPLASRMRLLSMALPGGLLLDLGRLRCFRCRRALA